MRARVVRWLAGPVVLAAALLSGCVEAEVQRQPETADDGLQATGRLEGGRVAISDGGPEVTLGDCDPLGEIDRDLCMVVRTINGQQLNLVVENPDALIEGERIPIRADSCSGPACDAVRDHAVVDLRLGDRELRATGGHLDVRLAGERYAARFELRLPNGGELTGRFNVRPPSSGFPEEPSQSPAE